MGCIGISRASRILGWFTRFYGGYICGLYRVIQGHAGLRRASWASVLRPWGPLGPGGGGFTFGVGQAKTTRRRRRIGGQNSGKKPPKIEVDSRDTPAAVSLPISRVM